MLSLLLAAGLATPVLQDFTVGTMRLRVSMRSGLFMYEVTNQGTGPLVHFEVPYSDGYGFEVPAGWEHTAEDGLFRATARTDADGIPIGQSGRFAFRLTNKGAVLGVVGVTVTPVHGEPVRFPAAWGATIQPLGYPLLIGVVALACCALQAVRARRTARLGTSAAAPRPASS